MSYSNMNFDAIGTIQRARAQQLQSMMTMRSNFPYSNGGGYQQPQQQQQAPTNYGGFYGNDTVSIGGNNWGYNAGNDGGRLSDGTSIADLFSDNYRGSDPVLTDALEKLAAARRLYGTPKPKEGQKGDLRVIAGDRADGVKPKEVRIDDANNYDYQKAENSYQDNRQETRFKDGTVGREYDVTVTWEDGTTTKKRVTLKQPNQIVYMDRSW